MRTLSLAVTLVAAGLWTLGPASAQTSGSQTPRHTKSASQGQTTTSESSTSGLSKADRDFITKAAEGGLTEVELGKIAQEKGTADAVKELGQRLVQDHSKANDDLQKLAQSKGVTLPTAPDSKQKALIDRMSRLSDGEFDREFARHTVADHKKDIAEFRKEADKGTDPDVKSWASQTIPTLEEHEKLAMQAENTGTMTTGKRSTGSQPRTDESGNPSTSGRKK